MWRASVDNRDWPAQPGLSAAEQRAGLLAYLDLAVERRLDTVILQVRPTADALWPSPCEPWSGFLTGVQGQHPGWDPLRTAVAEAHRRGLGLHAWFNSATDPRGSDTTAGVQTYDDLYADTRKWVRRRWIDHVVPQLYWNIGFPAADYARLLPWWAEVVRGTGVGLHLGEAPYKAGDPAQPAPWQDPAELSRHLTLASGFHEVRGHVFFAAKEVATDPSGAMARVVADHYDRAPHP